MKEHHRWMLLATILMCVTVPLCSEEILMQNASTPAKTSAATASPSWMNGSTTKLQHELTTKYGEQQRVRIERGIRQVSEFWRADDGDA
jgi:hypothetical protein